MFKKLTVFLAAAVILLSSCVSDTSWVLKNGDATVSSGVYLGFLVQTELNELSEHNAQSVSDLMKMTIHEMKAADYITDQALTLSKNYIAIEKKFDELGLSLTEDDLAEVDSMVATYKSYYGPYFSDNGCGDNSLKDLIENNIKMEKIFFHLYDENGEKAVSDADKRAFFKDNYSRIQYIAVPLVDTSTGSALTGDKLTAAQNTATSYYDKAKAGEDFISLLNAYAKESGDTKTEYKAELQENGLTNADILISKENTDYPEAITTAVFEMAVGDIRKVTTDDGCYIIKKLELNESEKTYEYYKESLLTEMRSEEFTELQNEWKDAFEYEINNASVKRYHPKKLKFETASY
ncbi:MAG: hypothetical protein J6K88_01935 [Oscillospiraceae bacterium]|nr:hypothetical protein [Oscillospiraceae bacterium]